MSFELVHCFNCFYISVYLHASSSIKQLSTFILGVIAESTSDTANCDRRRTYPRSVVTLVHPAKAVGRNEMLFGRDTGVAPSNTVQ